MPAEWEPHEAVWLQWPDASMRDNSAFYARKLHSTWLEMAAVLADHVRVDVIAGNDTAAERIERDCAYYGVNTANVRVHIVPIEDVWARDNGPIFVKTPEDSLAVTGWNFNCYGNLAPHENDKLVAKAVADLVDLPYVKTNTVTEGGAIEVNGTGSMIATRSSILNDNRNPGKTQEQIEEDLGHFLGIRNFIWLSGASTEECFSLGDGTDWHVDIAARFTNQNTVLACWTDDESDPRRPYFERHFAELTAATDEVGNPLDVIKLPSPHMRTVNPLDWTGEIVPPGAMTDAAYTNYLVTNGLVLLPVYGQQEDETARSILAEQFPDREVVGISTLTLTEEGGAIHCVTQQQPAA